MNIWNNTVSLLGGIAFIAMTNATVSAQTCDGVISTLPPEVGEFQNTLFQFDWTNIPVRVPAWSPVGSETLVKATVTFELEITGDISFTNNSGTTCPTVSWAHTTNYFATPPFPLPGFFPPPGPEFTDDFGFFSNINVGATDTQPSDFALIIEGPFEFKDSEASPFIGNPGDQLTFLTDVEGVFSATGCSPGLAETDLDARVTVTVQYTVCTPGPDPGDCLCPGPSAHYRKPGSLLLYPEFDNREGDITLMTITNSNCSGTEDLDVEIVFIDSEDCGEFNTTITLTPCDTFTAITNFVNPNMEQGYFYAFAKNDAGDAVTRNSLIGQVMVISGIEQFDYSINPVSFLGMTGEGNGTDLDDDDIRDLDGLEYDMAPDTITIPRFLGQGLDANQQGPINSHLILIGLSGGQDFSTTICFDVFNDNEESFSGEYTFYCWEKPTLLEIRGTFANSFLRTTDHDPNEILGAADRRESGWICIDGCVASSTQESIANPAFYAVLVERISSYSVSDLPFECGGQANGALLPRGIFGDGDPIPVNGDNQ